MINSSSNKQIKNLSQLLKNAKTRRKQRVFVVEGRKMYQEVPEEQLLMTYVSESFYADPEHRKLLEGRQVEVVADRIFASVSDTVTPQGILCVVKQKEYQLEEILKDQQTPLLLVLENLQDPGNLGTIFRTAEAAGVQGILMSDDTVDIYNPKVIRSTMGSVYRVPFIYTADLYETVQELKQRGICTYAAHLKAEKEYTEQDYREASAFLIGNEGNGLSDKLTNVADEYIRISMAGKVESLNAAVAAAVLMFEAKRQRS
ncbi:MAG: 23S rRNA (guanosine(2251)-2'-O)-methyltransferase RlmB [Eubacteriales bacterium]|nr:23S rRNA (guanosine(2251)-2'-O)-methyltransferase RlmB [Eubacteriales bacterium]